MKIRNHHDLWSGVMFGGFGILFMILSQQYQLGTSAKMGPGYFPTMLGGLCTFLGFMIGLGAFRGTHREDRVAKIGWREITLILLGVALFAALLPALGIIVALIVLILVSSLASHEFRFRDAVIASVVLLIMSYLVFVKGLELQFPLLPKFMTK
ncbi:MAG TPA: tripartite tricarboxylate transporter TctB family protein [Burkholderiaceae bacterium]|mgnify:CR=1 FL=1|jgi:uncharacterized protein YacL|nr:tripartite tricarboxylate transporter TctB family protein [Burkholderiaceae bacterium]